MKIAVVGSGYVGLVAGACLAENGNEVVCVDKDRRQNQAAAARQDPDLRAWAGGNGPPEPRGEAADLHDRRSRGAVRSAQIIFIAVGTPHRRGWLGGPAARARRGA